MDSDEWWNISFSCCARDLLLQPSLLELFCKVEETKVSVLIHLYYILTQSDKAIADSTQLLTQLSQQATYCINLRIERLPSAIALPSYVGELYDQGAQK